MNEPPDPSGIAGESLFSQPAEPETTGRYLVVFREDSTQAAMSMLSKKAGFTVASSADFDQGAVDGEGLGGADAIVFDQLGVCLVSSIPEQMNALVAQGEGDSAIQAIEPERIMYAISEDVARPEDVFGAASIWPEPPLEARASTDLTPGIAEYLRGYRAGVEHLVGSLLDEQVQDAGLRAGASAIDEATATWGLQATGVLGSTRTGKGIRVAVLDTGLDLKHPDYADRKIVSQSFIRGQAVQDRQGHGTHCIGTACGPARPAVLPRYGVASGSQIYAGKVLSDQGSGADGGILAGINWALTNRCRIVSMSLGARVRPGEAPSTVYETVARRALKSGTLIIAAAGNESDRRVRSFSPVGRPANSPSILAVGAVDAQMRMAYFSNRAINPNGGEINIAGPGVNVYSTSPMPKRYVRLNGTSMATPHVAGIAALYAEANPKASALALWKAMAQQARRLPHPVADVGCGLVQAP